MEYFIDINSYTMIFVRYITLLFKFTSNRIVLYMYIKGVIYEYKKIGVY